MYLSITRSDDIELKTNICNLPYRNVSNIKSNTESRIFLWIVGEEGKLRKELGLRAQIANTESILNDSTWCTKRVRIESKRY